MTYNVWETCVLVNMGLSTSECASWVQAWGSIGAIAAAAWAVHRAHRLQQQAKEREEAAGYTRFLEQLFQLIGGTRMVARKIWDLENLDGGSSPDDRRTMLAELASISDALKRVELSRLDRYHYVEAWLVADALTRKLMDAVRMVDAAHKIPQVEKGNLHHLAERAVETLDERGKRLYKAIEDRGGPPGAEPLPSDWTKRAPADH